MEESTGIIINATKNQIEEFKSSILWQDIIRELDFWLEGFTKEQDSIVDSAKSENPSTASVLLHLGDINGRKKAVTFMKQILDVFTDVLEAKENDSRRNKAD